MGVLGQGEMCLEDLEAAVRAFLGREGRGVDLKRYRAIIDSLEGDFAAVRGPRPHPFPSPSAPFPSPPHPHLSYFTTLILTEC